MKKEILNKFFGIILIAVFMVSIFATSLVANSNAQSALSTASQIGQSASLVEGLLSGGGDILTKVFGLNPIIHGVLVGGFSAVNTFSRLSKVEIDYIIDRDKVNISEHDSDYFTPLDQHLVRNKISQNLRLDNMLLTDKNLIPAEFINVRRLSEIDDGSNSPSFRLSENTSINKIFDSNNQIVDIQKRQILFEDKDGTIEHEYEHRNFIIRYAKSTYDSVDYELTFSDIFSGNLVSLFIPFTTGANLVRVTGLLDGTNENFFKRLNENKKEEIKNEQFRLLFNSYIRDTIDDSLELDMVNCISESGMILGRTGSEALPHLALNWTFQESLNVQTISGQTVNTLNWCDAELTGQQEKHFIYCDATQFTIQVLNKLKQIDNFVQQNKSSFVCPTPGVTQNLVSYNDNIGLTNLNSYYQDSFVNVDYRIEGSFASVNHEDEGFEEYGSLVLSVLINNSPVASETIPLTITDFVNGVYVGEESFNVGVILEDTTQFKVLATIVLQEPFNSLDSDLDNILENVFTLNQDICDLENTSRNINLFSPNVKINTSLVESRAYLMKDGFSNDFKQDFDRYYRHTIMAAPSDYIDRYHKYLISDRFNFMSSFDSEPGRLVLQGPGRYNVLIDVEFDDQWNLFDISGNLTGNVDVILTRELPPERDSPLYYMPFNGLVGVDSDNARQGYGVDYTGDIITINEFSTNQYLRTEPFTQSNTINTISVREYGKQANEFSFLNNGQTRGMLLNINISPTKSNPEIFFIPSRATPVGLKVSNQANDAYSFYKLDIGGPQGQGGEPALTPGTLVPWTGVGECLDFTGVSVVESFNGRPDVHAISSRLAPTTPSQTVAYGVEWEVRNITRRGNVFLRTIFYTPSNFKNGNALSVLQKDSYDDDAWFYTTSVTGGSKSVELQNIFGQDIKYLSDIYDLVNQKQACIDYTGSSLKVYYNPVSIYENFFNGSMETDAQNAWVQQRGECIKN